MKSLNKKIFYGAMFGTFGYLTAYMLIGLFSLVFLSSGFYLIQKFNKKNTELFVDIQPIQYIGILLCLIGIIPFIRYIIISLLFGMVNN